MAVDAASLAAALALEVQFSMDDPPVPVENDPGIVNATRLLEIAGPLVDAYLRGGTAPEAIRDEAIIRTAGHLLPRRSGHEAGTMRAGMVQMNLAPVGVSAVRQSGAAALLAPWVRRTA